MHKVTAEEETIFHEFFVLSVVFYLYRERKDNRHHKYSVKR